MPKENLVLVEEFHVTVRVNRRLDEPSVRAIRRTLESRRFKTQLARSIHRLLRRSGSLRLVTIEIST